MAASTGHETLLSDMEVISQLVDISEFFLLEDVSYDAFGLTGYMPDIQSRKPALDTYHTDLLFDSELLFDAELTTLMENHPHPCDLSRPASLADISHKTFSSEDYYLDWFENDSLLLQPVLAGELYSTGSPMFEHEHCSTNENADGESDDWLYTHKATGRTLTHQNALLTLGAEELCNIAKVPGPNKCDSVIDGYSVSPDWKTHMNNILRWTSPGFTPGLDHLTLVTACPVMVEYNNRDQELDELLRSTVEFLGDYHDEECSCLSDDESLRLPGENFVMPRSVLEQPGPGTKSQPHQAEVGDDDNVASSFEEPSSLFDTIDYLIDESLEEAFDSAPYLTQAEKDQLNELLFLQYPSMTVQDHLRLFFGNYTQGECELYGSDGSLLAGSMVYLSSDYIDPSYIDPTELSPYRREVAEITDRTYGGLRHLPSRMSWGSSSEDEDRGSQTLAINGGSNSHSCGQDEDSSYRFDDVDDADDGPVFDEYCPTRDDELFLPPAPVAEDVEGGNEVASNELFHPKPMIWFIQDAAEKQPCSYLTEIEPTGGTTSVIIEEYFSAKIWGQEPNLTLTDPNLSGLGSAASPLLSPAVMSAWKQLVRRSTY